MAGKAVKDPAAAAVGSVALALHVRAVAAYYGIPVVLHSDHCAKKVRVRNEPRHPGDGATMVTRRSRVTLSHLFPPHLTLRAAPAVV